MPVARPWPLYRGGRCSEVETRVNVWTVRQKKEIGSLRNNDNKNGKKAIGLDKQNNNFARASRFFVHFSAVVARLQRKTT